MLCRLANAIHRMVANAAEVDSEIAIVRGLAWRPRCSKVAAGAVIAVIDASHGVSGAVGIEVDVDAHAMTVILGSSAVGDIRENVKAPIGWIIVWGETKVHRFVTDHNSGCLDLAAAIVSVR